MKTDDEEVGDDGEGAALPSEDTGREYDDSMTFMSFGTNAFDVQDHEAESWLTDGLRPYAGTISSSR